MKDFSRFCSSESNTSFHLQRENWVVFEINNENRAANESIFFVCFTHSTVWGFVSSHPNKEEKWKRKKVWNKSAHRLKRTYFLSHFCLSRRWMCFGRVFCGTRASIAICDWIQCERRRDTNFTLIFSWIAKESRKGRNSGEIWSPIEIDAPHSAFGKREGNRKRAKENVTNTFVDYGSLVGLIRGLCTAATRCAAHKEIQKIWNHYIWYFFRPKYVIKKECRIGKCRPFTINK